MEFIVYTVFTLAALYIASELNAQPQPTAAPVATVEPTAPQSRPACAKSVEIAPRLTIPTEEIEAIDAGIVESYAGLIESAPIDWDAWSLREARQCAKSLGIKGFGRMNTTTVRAAIEAAIA